MATKAEIGNALDGLVDDVIGQIVDLTAQYRSFGHEGVLKQSIDTPHRAKAQIVDWISRYDSRNGSGSAVTFLAECLTAAGSAKTIAGINTEITTLETQAEVVVNRVLSGQWTLDQAADAIEAAFTPEPEEDFTYLSLPIPDGYITVWGDPH